MLIVMTMLRQSIVKVYFHFYKKMIAISVYAVRFAFAMEQLQFQESSTKEFILSNSDFLLEQLEKRSEFGVWNKMYRRDRIQNIRFASGRLNEDVIWSTDLAENLHNGVAVTNCVYYYYRQRQGSIMAGQSLKGSVDFIWAGQYLLQMARRKFPELEDKCLRYAIEYPWSFVDRIYVQRTFTQNKAFLYALRDLLRENSAQYKTLESLSHITRRRMALFRKKWYALWYKCICKTFRVYIIPFTWPRCLC